MNPVMDDVMASRDADLGAAIRSRDVRALVALMFEGSPPAPRSGFKTEGELWDFKSDCPHLGKSHRNAWAHFALDVLGFHNHHGGVIVFGINDRTYTFVGATQILDSKQVNDQLRRFLGDRIWVEYHREFIQDDQKHLGIAVVPPRGPQIARFRIDAPHVDGKQLFKAGESAIRRGDSTFALSKQEADGLSRSVLTPTLGLVYAVDEPFFRILSAEYSAFIERGELGTRVTQALSDPRASTTALVGIGGVGKTALATWAALRAYDTRSFDFIVSITAKDRELTVSGIQALVPALSSFEALLDNIADVLGFRELKALPIDRKESEIRSLISGSKGLLFVDNLETVDDARIITFLDELPVGVRALTTSRRARVRVSVRPIDAGPFSDDEVTRYIRALSRETGLSHAADLTVAECTRIGESCDRIPLAIRWALARSRGAAEALAAAEDVTRSSRRGEELLEFCFRRIFDRMPDDERAVVSSLSLFQRPLPAEAVVIGAGLSHVKFSDVVNRLTEDALVQRLFDSDLNDYVYTLLPITRAFVYGQVRQTANAEEQIRARMTDYFEARDVREDGERLVVRALRQGRGNADEALLDLALAAQRKRDFQNARDLYLQALQRNPGSWKAARLFAEFHRHCLNNTGEALRYYEQAASHAPRRGPERALIFREWGMLLRQCGDPNATPRAIENFEIALKETPNDEIAMHALATMLDREGYYLRVIEVLEPIKDHSNERTRSMVRPLLKKAYEKTGDMLKACSLR